MLDNMIFMPVKTKLVKYVEGVVPFSTITLACVYKAHEYRELNFMDIFEVHLLTSLGKWLHRACATNHICCIKFSKQNVTPPCATSLRD